MQRKKLIIVGGRFLNYKATGYESESVSNFKMLSGVVGFNACQYNAIYQDENCIRRHGV